MTDMFRLTNDGKSVLYIPTDEVAPNMQCIVDNLNDLSNKVSELKEHLEEPLDLYDDFKQWDMIIGRLDKDNRRLLEIKEVYVVESQRIIEEAKKLKIDFNALYGANNQKTRQQYADEQLEDLLKEKQELKFRTEDDARRLSYLKELIHMKIKLMDYVGEGSEK